MASFEGNPNDTLLSDLPDDARVGSEYDAEAREGMILRVRREATTSNADSIGTPKNAVAADTTTAATMPASVAERSSLPLSRQRSNGSDSDSTSDASAIKPLDNPISNLRKRLADKSGGRGVFDSVSDDQLASVFAVCNLNINPIASSKKLSKKNKKRKQRMGTSPPRKSSPARGLLKDPPSIVPLFLLLIICLGEASSPRGLSFSGGEPPKL